jgi:protein involved in ribonucleotide reduction
MLDIVYFSNVSQTTKRLVEKLDVPGQLVRIPVQGAFEGTAPQRYVLVLPTYGDSKGRRHVPHQVIKFLNVRENRAGIIGIIGTGNRNFGKYFAEAGREVSRRLHVPLLHTAELAGNTDDIDLIQGILNNLADTPQHIAAGVSAPITQPRALMPVLAFTH